jgi:hypothetical protein
MFRAGSGPAYYRWKGIQKMAKIGNEELDQLTAEVMPERPVLSAGLPVVGQLPIVGGLTQGLPLVGGGGGS